MGRRSINTTKSGKYMNPTDQARKEARKKELKKNKKQRQMVRAAVLKGKDPAQLIEEMEKIDEMEYNVYQPSPLNEKVLREKRKKLKETFDRVMRLYHNDDPELWAELKRKEVEYEKRRNKKVQYFESVKHAQTVQVDEIPLPQMTTEVPSNIYNMPGRIPLPSLPLPPFVQPPVTTAAKKPVEVQKEPEKRPEVKKKEPPGCPPGPPPDLAEMREFDSDYDSEEDEPKSKKQKLLRHEEVVNRKDGDKNEDLSVKQPTSLQQRMLAISGQNIDEFMKEMENVQKKKEQERAADLHERLSTLDKDKESSDNSESESESESEGDDKDESDDDDDDEDEVEPPVVKETLPPAPAFPSQQPIKLPSGPPPPVGLPPAMMFRPPPLRPNMQPPMAIRMPPGPPPRPGMPPMPRMGIRMPPGPPPGMPPNRMHHNNHHKPHTGPGVNILSAGPQLTKDTKGMTTITAKPQIRNLSADVTRFVPSTLRVKRDEGKKQQQRPKQYVTEAKQPEASKTTTKDDAYMQFMREMQGLI
ncbi:WW domain-binding protein 11 [Pseudolycoriella hygida]|uniref:WW domain-binding protein 11 n=1 Tax=Pseudolycoriella hygida TaxID=35572 RepID=A0A9Q0MUX1_9DIPT|nr:WW domain-binding protein 11 [Pseudolycoriella hygida]